MTTEVTRRDLFTAAATLGAGALLRGGSAASAAQAAGPFPLSLNTSTLRPASLEDKVEIAAKAGYDAIELWSNELDKHAGDGKSLKDLGKRVTDLGLFVPNIIGLFGCMPPQDDRRPQALETARKRMDCAAQVGAKCIAAIPAGNHADIDLFWAAQRYQEFLSMGREFGLKVAFEFVGFFKSVYTLGQATCVALEAKDRTACLVADTFHLFRGGSGFDGIRHLNGDFLHIFHFNDAPADKPREQQGDGDRVYPGDGHLPLVQLVRDLKAIGYTGPLSLEVFNQEYYKQDPLTVARTGIEKMRAVVAAA
ncbi:MAG: xylose isomerase [Armatimonadetes bacterium CG_4_10_14_3_um_filter_66_18]|nr:sugar phosphate isomerase/epimerase [Armatimonadota bacterium]OIP09930.1 MAG: hypothetical protein AUJ96_04420 [Armatimonadetes bacterium CG2_30_66_41]PIU88701.1 MAG: xylose isomerase [Armatimonadetes bacterium CG06_land_8_20_14_3_00_66_21]PIX49326.1 MAG: xylose isomerase [Armatimonadetes bacterium CG_4_8_14_3_um_filter_66_20]PIY50219.1 MAG: xylose isomerase [Armatimonadetes bacterium CG_4_10_14_3_um_filter_66_18]PIZ49751.1 MAG: xylose isomerase [Armatimonadetes bacterium CG_4_10_14_0_8_um_